MLASRGVDIEHKTIENALLCSSWRVLDEVYSYLMDNPMCGPTGLYLIKFISKVRG